MNRKWRSGVTIAAIFALCAIVVRSERTFGQTLANGALQSGGAAGTGGTNGVLATSDVMLVQDVCRIEGQGTTILRGMGIVTGLKRGSGDSGSELALARPLAKVYEANGNPLPDLKELAKAQTAALVAIEVVVPAQGARLDDEFDIRVTALHSASSLAGGQLMLSPISGPLPGQGVYAMGAGPIHIEDPATTTSGVVRGGARMIQSISMPAIRDQLVLTILPSYRYYSVATQISDAINGFLNNMSADTFELGERATALDTASVIDDTAILVKIPEQERGNVPLFVAQVMRSPVTLSLIRQPAEIRVNPRTGSIVFTDNVEISPVAISHKNIVLQTVVPPAPATAANPRQIRENAVGIDTTNRPRERARIGDLLAAFRALDVPIDDRINIIIQLHRSGRLHGRLVVE